MHGSIRMNKLPLITWGGGNLRTCSPSVRKISLRTGKGLILLNTFVGSSIPPSKRSRTSSKLSNSLGVKFKSKITDLNKGMTS